MIGCQKLSILVLRIKWTLPYEDTLKKRKRTLRKKNSGSIPEVYSGGLSAVEGKIVRGILA